jgi:hypothetical protein
VRLEFVYTGIDTIESAFDTSEHSIDIVVVHEMILDFEMKMRSLVLGLLW